MSEKGFFVYGHHDSTGLCRYVGSGSYNRMYDFKARSKNWLSVFGKSKPIVKAFARFLDREKALEEEMRLINQFEQWGLPLVNKIKTKGFTFADYSHEDQMRLAALRSGPNHWCYGKERSQETKQKISIAKKANPTRYWLGKKRDPELIKKMTIASHSPEAKEKRRAKVLGRKWSDEERKAREKTFIKRKVKCLQNGIIYSSLKEAGKALNVQPNKIGEVCSGKRKTTKGFTFSYAT